jgi:putative Mg2+ transporter-C (MgtC) family protein
MDEADIILRLLMAVACGGLIGIERERGDRPAGFKTYILVTLGACLFTILSLIAFPNSDTARVAAQVVVGIGFLGAGVILVYGGTHVVGITTAATMWAMAAVGMAAGAGHYLTSLYTTLIILAVLIALPWVEQHVIARFQKRNLYFTIRGRHRHGLLEDINGVFSKYETIAKLLRYHSGEDGKEECSFLLRAKVSGKFDILDVMESLYAIDDVIFAGFEE